MNPTPTPPAADRPAGASAYQPAVPTASGLAPRDAGEVTYAYSFDRQSFRGRFETRRGALEAARKALPLWPAAAEALYVGRRIDPALHVHGHAALVLDAMRRRALDAGDVPPDHDPLPAGARRDLDARLADLLRDWLVAHDLLGRTRIEEISEHALPLVSHVDGGDEVEVGPVGVEG